MVLTPPLPVLPKEELGGCWEAGGGGQREVLHLPPHLALVLGPRLLL